ncbi:MAG: ATP-binding protein, partial [Microterricola sp.]
GGVRLEIADTGIGFDVDKTPSARIGLRVSILERIAAVGGESTVHSAPGAGTTIVLEWPAANAVPEQQGVDA